MALFLLGMVTIDVGGYKEVGPVLYLSIVEGPGVCPSILHKKCHGKNAFAILMFLGHYPSNSSNCSMASVYPHNLIALSRLHKYHAMPTPYITEHF
jgi:hypothetical protein